MEFFDKKDNWSEQSVRVGRPWKKDELRLKSNEDLHKLWYILLKERNMLMTMAEEYKRQTQLFPNPERLEKVEESMENLLDIVAERDRAFSLLETGESCEPGRRWAYNELGIGYWQKCTEHRVPLHVSRRFQRTTVLSGPWQHRYIKLRREKLLAERQKKLRHIAGRLRAYKKVFPDADIDVDLSEFQNTMTKTLMKGPSSS
jgi:large subunit ribosomal protein L47